MCVGERERDSEREFRVPVGSSTTPHSYSVSPAFTCVPLAKMRHHSCPTKITPSLTPQCEKLSCLCLCPLSCRCPQVHLPSSWQVWPREATWPHREHILYRTHSMMSLPPGIHRAKYTAPGKILNGQYPSRFTIRESPGRLLTTICIYELIQF